MFSVDHKLINLVIISYVDKGEKEDKSLFIFLKCHFFHWNNFLYFQGLKFNFEFKILIKYLPWYFFTSSRWPGPLKRKNKQKKTKDLVFKTTYIPVLINE